MKFPSLGHIAIATFVVRALASPTVASADPESASVQVPKLAVGDGKVSVYRFAPADPIVIWSASLLLARLSFHLPMRGSSAARDVAAMTQAKQSN